MYKWQKINGLFVNNKKNNIIYLYRRIYEYKKGYEARINVVNDENGNFIPDSYKILNWWKNYFTQLLNVHIVRQIEVHTVEQLVPKLKFAIAKLKIINRQVLMKLSHNWFKNEVIILLSEVHYCLIIFGIRKNSLTSRRSLLLYQSARRAIKLSVLIILAEQR
jgi:hypothetical protein